MEETRLKEEPAMNIERVKSKVILKLCTVVSHGVLMSSDGLLFWISQCGLKLNKKFEPNMMYWVYHTEHKKKIISIVDYGGELESDMIQIPDVVE